MAFFRIYILLSYLSLSFIQKQASLPDFDKATFYKILSSNSITDINLQINKVKTSEVREKEAYEGALLMKKSGLISNAKEKLGLFKNGRTKLEVAINNDKQNTEYRFLRLIIQENAPKIVKYKNQMEEDSKLININFNSLSPDLQKVITDYSKKSKFLKLSAHN